MRSRNGNVLIVEDEPLIALDLQFLLEEAGYRVIGPATTVAEALELADRYEIRAALLDLNLNGQLATEVVNRLLDQSVPVVVLSGYEATVREPPYSLCPFLQKPYAADEVLRMLDVVIARQDQRDTTNRAPLRRFC